MNLQVFAGGPAVGRRGDIEWIAAVVAGVSPAISLVLQPTADATVELGSAADTAASTGERKSRSQRQRLQLTG